MNMIDFSFGNDKLSDYGYMVCSIVTSFPDSSPIGTQLNFETLKNRAASKNKIVSVSYEDPSEITFDICKKMCGYTDDIYITDNDISILSRWLNSKSYAKFKPIYNDASYADVYFQGTFSSISAINVGGDVVGMTLTFIPSSPFGYEDDKEIVFNIDSSDYSFSFYDDSDEVGYLYPSLYEITFKQDGNLTLSNSLDPKNTVIKNCKNGEVITMDCENKVITSSKSHVTLYNDFNYNFPRFVNTLEERENVFTVSITCSIRVIYSPIRKAGVIL